MSNEKYCQNCGEPMHINARVCNHCGSHVAPQQQYQQQPQGSRDKWVAFLLCFIFGTFGVHKFYEGKPFQGLLYLFTFGIFGIGYLVDLFLILAKPNRFY